MLRRDFLTALLAVAAAVPLAPRPAGAAAPAQPFDRAWLRDLARRMAGSRYVPPVDNLPAAFANLGHDAWHAIRFRADKSLWAGDGSPIQARFFHPGSAYRFPVMLFEVDAGMARPIPYDSALFDDGKRPLSGARDDLGFAGLRLLRREDGDRDFAAFIGASYFRAVGEEGQYGLSARGLALDTGLTTPEEFPRFTAFWLERPQGEAVTVHALLDSPSVAGAYSFVIRRSGGTVMDVAAALYPRRVVERFGIAPLTSMYQHGENDMRVSDDFRPEIHNSDGLALWTGRGERVWRPLMNPPVVRTNSFLDDSPKGFGLLQRDREFDHFQDDGAYYDRRPGLWVEPLGKWGRGAVQLVEIPIGDETGDNIVAYWLPERPAAFGDEIALDYRLHWTRDEPFAPAVGTVRATRQGKGGTPGQARTHYARKFVVDFAGGPLGGLGVGDGVQAVVDVSRGTVESPGARPLREIGGWRATFDLRPDETQEPIDLRLFLRQGDRALTETWVYQWFPTSRRRG